jgi:hypothetical protein
VRSFHISGIVFGMGALTVLENRGAEVLMV